MSGFTIPTPEQIQYALGVHPVQVAASQDASQALQDGDQAQQVSQDQPSQEPPESSQPSEAPAPPKSVITPPSTSGRVIPVGTRPYGPPAPEESEEPAPAPDTTIGAPPTSSISGLMPSGPRPISGDQAREEKDQAELDRLRKTGSGVEQFQHRHHIAGPLVRALSIAGSVVAPHVAALIPGTDLHHQLLENQAEGRVGQDLREEKEHADIANRDEVNRIRQESEDDKRARDKELDEVRRKAEEFKEQNRDITYDKASGQFMRGGRPYIPAHTEEGMLLEVGHGIVDGPYTKKWDAEKKNQAPQTHIHNPSAESEHYNDVKSAFRRQYGHYPQSPDDFATFNTMLKGERGSKTTPRTFKDSAGIDKYSTEWYDRQRKAVVDEKAKVTGQVNSGIINKSDAAGEYRRIEDEYGKRAQQFEGQKRQWYDQVNGGRPVRVNEDENGVPQATTAVTRPSGSGPLTEDEASTYLQLAGGDKKKARQMAKEDGRSF